MATDRDRIEGEFHYAAKNPELAPPPWFIHRKSDDRIIDGTKGFMESTAQAAVEYHDAEIRKLVAAKQHIKSPSPETPGLRGDLDAALEFTLDLLDSIVENRNIEREATYIWGDAGAAATRIRKALGESGGEDA